MDRDIEAHHRIPIVFAGLGIVVSLTGLLVTASWGADASSSGSVDASVTEVRTDEPVTRSSAPAESALAGLAPDDATSEYLEIVHEGRSSLETGAYLVEWLRANPKSTSALVQMLRTRAASGERTGWSGLLSALDRAETPQAQEALVALRAELDGESLSVAHARSMIDPGSGGTVLASSGSRRR